MRYRNYGNYRQSSFSDFYKNRFLVVAHAVLLSIMLAYLTNINKAMKTQEQNLKAFSDAVAAGTGVGADVSSSTCRSTYSFELAKKFKTYNEILFYTFVASGLLNLVYIAFSPTLSSSKLTLLLVYGILAVAGIVGIGFSVDGYIKIRSLTKEPQECQRMFDNYKSFFIVAMTASVVQAFFSLWILSPLFTVKIE